MCERTEWHRAAVRRANVNVLQFGRILLKVGHRLQDDVILIGLGKEGRDLTLAESVIERLIDRLGCYPQSRSRDAINDQRALCPTSLLISSYILELRQGLQFVYELCGPGVQLIWIRIFQSVLVLRA